MSKNYIDAVLYTTMLRWSVRSNYLFRQDEDGLMTSLESPANTEFEWRGPM